MVLPLETSQQHATEDLILSTVHKFPPTPGNPHFVGYSINVGGGYAVGAIFKTAEIAEETASRLKLKTYSIHEEWYE